MAAVVTVTIPGAPGVNRVQAELTLIAGLSQTYVLPITDPAATYSNLESNWTEVSIAGQKPFNVRAGDKLHQMQVKVTIAPPDGGTQDPDNTVETIIAGLMNLASSDGVAGPVAFTWGTLDSSAVLTQTGYWHIDAMTIDSTWRQPGTNNVSQATATLTLKEVSDPPAAAFVQPGWTAPPAPPAPIQTSTAPYQIVVAQGDTLYSIAAAVYGNPEPGWRNIAAANNINNPAQVTTGQVLLIPHG